MSQKRLRRQTVWRLKQQGGRQSVRRKARRSVCRAVQQAGGRSIRLEAIQYGESTTQQTMTPISESLSEPSIRSSSEPLGEPPKSIGISKGAQFNHLSGMHLRQSTASQSKPQLLEQGSFHRYNHNLKSSKIRLNEARSPILKSKKKRQMKQL